MSYTYFDMRCTFMLKLSKSLLWMFMTIEKCHCSGLSIKNHLSDAIFGVHGGKIELRRYEMRYIWL